MELVDGLRNIVLGPIARQEMPLFLAAVAMRRRHLRQGNGLGIDTIASTKLLSACHAHPPSTRRYPQALQQPGLA